jgi:hypothetical protein
MSHNHSCENIKFYIDFQYSSKVVNLRLKYSFHELRARPKRIIIIIIIIIVALQPFVGPWSLFKFLNPIHSR